MSIAGNIKKILLYSLWCLLGAGLVVLLVAAMNRKNSRTCRAYRIEINNNGQPLFMDEKSILNRLSDNRQWKLTGKAIASYDLGKMENDLKKDPWVKDAQLFFDNTETLRIKVQERNPVARIFSVSGAGFLMDSSRVQLPLPDHSLPRLPVFTGFPHERMNPRGADSVLLVQIRDLSLFLLSHPFWMADIEQIAITPARTFEMVPVLGNHLIVFGDAAQCEEKFHRLLVYYREVAAKTGFDRYSRLDLRFEGQVVGTRRGAGLSRADSLQAIDNIRQLIRQAQQWQADTVWQENIKPLEHNTITEQSLTNYDLVADEEDSSAAQPSKKETKSKNNQKKNNYRPARLPGSSLNN